MTHKYIGTKIVLAWAAAGKDGAPGYGVKYEDGYTSWSPKAQFEAAYLEIGDVSSMPAHQQRVVAEKAELDTKLSKLENFYLSKIFAGLPKDEQIRLSNQGGAMRVYSEILGARIAAFR